MKNISIQKLAVVGILACALQPAHSKPPVSGGIVTTKTCPCNMVPTISSKTNIKKVVKEFKKASPRSQRSQLVGFIKQYISNLDEATEEVMVRCARVYCDRVKGDTIYKLVQDLIKAKVKRPAQAKVMLALGKVLRDSSSSNCSVRSTKYQSVEQKINAFKTATPMQQKIQIADLVSQYISNPTEIAQELLIGYAQVYCDRVQSQALNRLIEELIMGDDQKLTQRKIMRLLTLR